MFSTRRIYQLVRKLGQVENRRRALSAEAAAYLLAARLSLIFVSFTQLARHLGAFVSVSDPCASKARTFAVPSQIHLAKEIGWAVTSAARYVPFRAVCLQQALAAHAMLRRRGIPSVMHFGVARGADDSLQAHAWLDASGVQVTGYPIAEGFTEIGCFV